MWATQRFTRRGRRTLGGKGRIGARTLRRIMTGMTTRTCSAAGCDKRHFCRGFCTSHYQAAKRQGAFTERVCSIDECDAPFYAKDLCYFHYIRDLHGVARDRPRGNVGGSWHWAWKEEPGYLAAHQRIQRARGKASEHTCVDCGGNAAHWSYDRTGVKELVGVEKGKPITYSLDPWSYSPRCHSCHLIYDRSPNGEEAR